MKRRIESFRKGIYIHLEELNLREGEGFGEYKGKGKEGRKNKKIKKPLQLVNQWLVNLLLSYWLMNFDPNHEIRIIYKKKYKIHFSINSELKYEIKKIFEKK